MKQDIRLEIEIPQGVTVDIGENVVIKGPKGEVKKTLSYPTVTLTSTDGKLLLEAKKGTKREKRMIGTYQAHIKNMIKGVTEGFSYELKICSGHFPMNVSVVGQEVVVKNFFGENFPRKVPLREGTTVKVEGEKIIIDSVDKEQAGQMAADIEKLTTIKGRDIRIFQDGCYITKKGDKVITG